MSGTVTEYVVGFLFDGKGHVALIRKLRPEWQKGRLNGIGGHIEEGETPQEAMVREFKEEAGVELEWEQFALMRGRGYRLHLFSARDSSAEPKTLTDEVVGWYEVDNLPEDILANLTWVIPMADYGLPIRAEIIHPSPVC
ncbi:MAG: NUDIX domain-containing protein [Dehalococcoidales bacterium]|nr:NUDIX domain-containing protein [Dehalococcoidales bacterium]